MRQRFNLSPVKIPQYAPADYTKPTFGQKQQFVKDKHIAKKLSPKQIKRIQEIVGTILYYCRVTEPMPLVALSALTNQQSKATEATKKALQRCLDYLFTFSNGTITYTASDMVL